jgi:hypothetical protein
MRILGIVSAAVAFLMLGALALGAGEGDKKEKETKAKKEKVALADLPVAVKEAAEKAVPGIVLTEAEKKVKGAETVYEVEGKVGDKQYELKITPEGKVLKTKVEDKDNDKDEKDGDNNDKDDGDKDDDK